MQLQEKSIEISNLRQELIEVRDEADCKIMEKFTKVFDQGQKVQSEKMEVWYVPYSKPASRSQ